MEEDSSAKEEREYTGEYYSHNPCYFLQKIIKAILKCLGVESNPPQEDSPSSEEQKDNKIEDPAANDPPLEEEEVSISAFRAFGRVPPRPPISSGGGPQIN